MGDWRCHAEHGRAFSGVSGVCGAIALAYPFFLVTFCIVRCIYPMFLRHGEISPDDAVWLRGLDRRCNGYPAVAASVPLLAVAGVTFLPPGDIPCRIPLPPCTTSSTAAYAQ
jgi:hypothetical protein